MNFIEFGHHEDFNSLINLEQVTSIKKNQESNAGIKAWVITTRTADGQFFKEYYDDKHEEQFEVRWEFFEAESFAFCAC